jgi:hypothetical protein
MLAASVSVGATEAAMVEADARCNPEGYLRVALYGSISSTLDWASPNLECKGMPRPAAAGARLYFSAAADANDESDHFDFIISLPELEPDQTVKETPVSVTLIEQDGGRFFNSGAASFCLCDITEQTAVIGAKEKEYVISGVLYCVAALVELNGKGSVTLSDLKFSGQLNWQVQQ